MGSVKESRFAFREAEEVDRDWRVGEASPAAGAGGGGIADASVFSMVGSMPSVEFSQERLEMSGTIVVVVAEGNEVITRGVTGLRSAAEERRRIS